LFENSIPKFNDIEESCVLSRHSTIYGRHCLLTTEFFSLSLSLSLSHRPDDAEMRQVTESKANQPPPSQENDKNSPEKSKHICLAYGTGD
jgi:hypothetical protein